MALLSLGAIAELGEAASWSFAVLGDQRDDGSYGINQPIVAAMAAQIATQSPAFVLCAGDQIHGINSEGGIALKDQYTHWKDAMDPILGISYPVRGNHETYGDVDTPGPDYAKHWMDNIANVLTQIPKNGPTNEVGMSYSFSKNNVFIVGLEQSYATSWYQVNQAWLNDQLKANTLPFTFVYGHYPAFSVVNDQNLANNPTQRDAFWKSLGDSSINVYFAGHTHLYNRAEISIDGGPQIQQIVIGTGGAELTTWGGTYPDSRVIGESHQEGSYGYSLVTVNGNTITVVNYIYNQTANTWTPFDTYTYTITSRNFGANDANQSLDPDTLTNYYQGIGLDKIGAGTLTLTAGATTYSDPITVSAGALTVDGDYSSVPVTIQSGGTVNLNAGALVAGVTVDAGGTLNGSGTVVGTLSDSGIVNLQTGNLVVATVYLNSGGSFNQTGGALDFTTFNQGGGTGAFTDLYLGRNAGNSSTYNLSAGSVTAANEYVGNSGTGTLNQTGGSNTLTGALTLAANAGSSGTYNLQGGSLTAGTINVNTGGLFNQTGGTLNAAIILSGGTLVAGTNNGLGNKTLTINGGTIGASAANITVDNTLAAIGGNFNLGGAAGTNLELTKNMTLTGNLLTHNGASNDTLSGNLTSTATGGITVTAGTLNLTGSNGGYAGTSTVTGGTLNLQGAGNYTGNNTVSGGTLNMNSASAITYSGANTVTGGTWNMSGVLATYSGASTVTGGTLNLSAGTLSGLLTLTGGTFNLSGTGTYTNPAPLTNSAGTTFNIATGSTMTIAGGLTNSGNTDVNGTLTGDLTNNAGALVGGNGTIIGNLTNSGTVSPGNSPGTLNVVGSYTQTASGTLRAEIASPSSYDKINVTGAPGTASLNGTLTPVLLGGYRPKANTVIPDIITTTGGLAGIFSAVTQPAGPTLLWQPYYTATSFGLTVIRDYNNQWLNLNPNQQAVGNMLNSVANGAAGDLNAVLDAIDALPANPDVQNAYKQISPEKANALPTLSFASANLQTRTLAQRFTSLRFADKGMTAPGNLGSFNFNYSQAEGIMLAYNGSDLSSLFAGKKAKAKENEKRWSLFAEAGVAFGNQKTSVNQTGYDFTVAGLTAGVDLRLRDHLLVGLASGYSHTGTGFHGSGGGVEANTLPLNAYAAYFPGPFYAYGSLGYALNLFNLERGINFGGLSRTARSSTTGHQFNVYGETGYDLDLKRFILTPTASLSYSSLWVDAFTEQDAGSLNLKVAAQSAASLQSGVGGRLTVPLKLGQARVVPQAYASYQHEFSDNSRGLNARLNQGSSTFTFKTDSPKRDFAVVGGTLVAGLTKNLTAQVNYNVEVGRGNYTAHYVNAGLRLEF